MKKRFIVVLLALIIAAQSFAVPAFAEETEELNSFCALLLDDTEYDVEFINLYSRASDTATIQGETVAVISTPFALEQGEHLGISFEMSKRYEDVDIAIGQANNLTTFIMPTITSSGLLVKTYTYSVMITAGVAGNYYIAIRNNGQDSISITNIKITSG